MSPQQVSSYGIGKFDGLASPRVVTVSEVKILHTHYDVSFGEGDSVENIIKMLNRVPSEARFIDEIGGPDPDNEGLITIRFEVEAIEERKPT